jgi:hypothetical protein
MLFLPGTVVAGAIPRQKKIHQGVTASLLFKVPTPGQCVLAKAKYN